MKCVLAVLFFTSSLCPHYIIEGIMDDVNLAANGPSNGGRNLDLVRGLFPPTRGEKNTDFDDVIRCATIDDVVRLRASLCPTGCSCSPASGQEVWMRLAIDCSGTRFNQSTTSQLTRDITQLLSDQCVSELQELIVTNTPLTGIPAAVCNLTRIRTLNFERNRLASLPSNCFTRMRNLTFFTATYNRLTSLQEGVFVNLHQLQKLWLYHNTISSVEPRVFDESANLTSLSIIDLSSNLLTELEPWPLIRGQHRPTTVFIQHNYITRFTNVLRWSFVCDPAVSPRLYDTTLDIHDNAIRHITDAIYGWNINGTTGYICLLNVAEGKPKLDFSIDNNPFTCDCRDYKIMSKSRWYPRSHWLDRTNCEAPPEHYNTKLLNVPLNELVCHVTDDCPSNCSCVKRPFNKSFEVTCPISTLTSLPYHLPDPDQPPPRKARFDLGFGGSAMRYLESRDYFGATYRLDVSRSRIETVTDDAWRSLQNTDRIDLSNNLLETLPLFLHSENITFRWLALHGNPLSCECGQGWLSTWLKSLRATGSLYLPDSVQCQSPTWLRNKGIWQLDEHDFCRNPDREKLFYSLQPTAGLLTIIFVIVVPTVAGAVLLVCAGLLLLYRYRVAVFAKLNLHPFDVDECDNEDMAFDAFVSCAWPDDAQAHAIVDRLERGNPEEDGAERGGFRVCYHTRDFPLGGVILRSIQQSIEHSKRVICLLSADFLASQFCMLEFRTAWQWNIQHKRHRLIVVKCAGVDEALNAATECDSEAASGVDDVRLFLSTYTYIDLEAADCWQKLLYAMPINRLPRVDADFHQQFFAAPDDNVCNDDDRDDEVLLADV